MDKPFYLSDTVRGIMDLQESLKPALAIAKPSWMEGLSWLEDANHWSNHLVPNLPKYTSLGAASILNKEWSDSIASIAENNKLIYSSFNFLQDQFSEIGIAKSVASIHSSFNSAINTITKDSLSRHNDWLLSTVKYTTAKVAEAAAVIEESATVNSADLEVFMNRMENIRTELIEKMDLGFNGGRAKATWIITIVSFFVMIIQSLAPLLKEKEAEKQIATRAQVDSLSNNVHHLMLSTIKSQTDTFFMRIPSTLYFKPNDRSQLMIYLKTGTPIYVSYKFHKWAHATTIDSDGLPVSGWVMKKYLSYSK